MSLLKTLRDAKAMGLSAEKSWEHMRTGILRAAKEEKWRPSEVAMTLADRQKDLIKVYGKRATEFLNAS